MIPDLRADLHIHSDNSVDAHTTIDEMCRAAVNMNFTTVCFTEHYDSNPKDEGYRFLNVKKYTDDIERVRETFGDRLRILKGIEFSEPNLYPREFDAILRMEFDFVLGSVHNLGTDGMFQLAHRRTEEKTDAKPFFERYYREVLKTVEFGGFDAIAHLDYPKRYFSEYYEPPDIIEEICRTLVRKNIALELNSKPICLGFSELNPSNTICTSYAQSGGVKVTIGSDAHSPEYIGKDFDAVSRIIGEFQFRPVGFLKRNEISLD